MNCLDEMKKYLVVGWTRKERREVEVEAETKWEAEARAQKQLPTEFIAELDWMQAYEIK